MKPALYLILDILLFFSYSHSQDLIINEIHIDPDATVGDANSDGIVSSNDDEFIELINNSGSDLDISNWTLSDGAGIKHTFNEGTIIPNNETIVVFGGGTPTNIPGLFQTTTSLGLNNSGDDVIIRNSSNTIIDQYTYGSEGNDNQSLARNPDKTGAFVKHTTIPTNSVKFSPGRSNSDNSPLPVELLNFNTKLINDKVLLTWETATEINNYGFEIQKSEFGNQNSEFKTIGFVNGHGNSNSNKYYSFTDNYPFSGENFYRLKQIDFDGSYEYSENVGISFMKSLQNFSLEQNYPNPFNPITKISFYIPNVMDASRHGGQVNAPTTLSVYDLLGELVTTLVNQNLSAGKYEIEFDGSNLSSGVYYYRLKTGNYALTKKMLLLK